MPDWWFRLRSFLRRLWVRTALFCLLAVLAAVIGLPVDLSMGDYLARFAEPEAIEQLLAILSSSMLVIATFSLGTMASAFATASQTATPRAEPLLLEDSQSQTAVATFVGSFLYAVVAQLGLGLSLYTAGGRLVLFVITLVLLVVIVATLVRWVDEIARLGRVHHTIDRLVAAAGDAAARRGSDPYLGGQGYTDLPAGVDVLADALGSVQNVDVTALERVRSELPGAGGVYLRVTPGDLCMPTTPVLRLVGWSDDAVQALLDRPCPSVARIGARRSLMADPGFGLIALSEVASRALSPGINDPGTAIDVLSGLARVLQRGVDAALDRDASEVRRPWLFHPESRHEEMLDRTFLPIIADGSARLEVQLHVQQTLAGIASLHPDLDGPSTQLARRACRIASDALPDDESRTALADAHARHFPTDHPGEVTHDGY